jgi:phospholipid/cholesterol/gamma-HCH transport system substrate-binding protein
MDGAPANHQLVIDVRRFRIATDAEPTAEIALSAKILNKEERRLPPACFSKSMRLGQLEAAAAAVAFNEAFAGIAKDLIGWTVESL